MSTQERIFGGVLSAHEAIYKASDGRVGHKLLGVPTLLLRTTGRRSGQTRTNALIYVRDGERYAIVASNGGARRPPAWFVNLRAEPEVELQIGRERQAATATLVERPDPDFERLWKAANKVNHGLYDTYQERTDRPIPIVVLSPRQRS